jgi:hypothetical protein
MAAVVATNEELMIAKDTAEIAATMQVEAPVRAPAAVA